MYAHWQKAHEWTLLLKTVMSGVGLRRGLGVEATQFDESGCLLSVGAADILEMFAECVRVIGNSVVNYHNASGGTACNGGIYERITRKCILGCRCLYEYRVHIRRLAKVLSKLHRGREKRQKRRARHRLTPGRITATDSARPSWCFHRPHDPRVFIPTDPKNYVHTPFVVSRESHGTMLSMIPRYRCFGVVA